MSQREGEGRGAYPSREEIKKVIFSLIIIMIIDRRKK